MGVAYHDGVPVSSRKFVLSSCLTQRVSWPSIGGNRTVCQLCSGVKGAVGCRLLQAVKMNSGLVEICAGARWRPREDFFGSPPDYRHLWELSRQIAGKGVRYETPALPSVAFGNTSIRVFRRVWWKRRERGPTSPRGPANPAGRANPAEPFLFGDSRLHSRPAPLLPAHGWHQSESSSTGGVAASGA